MSDDGKIIKSCPFCGCDKLGSVASCPEGAVLYAVQCLGCLARGPLSFEEFAMLNWQLREKKHTVDSTGFDMSAINKVLNK